MASKTPPRRDAAAISVSELKARCLRVIDEVREGGAEYVVTKHGKPVARILPIGEPTLGSPAGMWRGKVDIVGDIVHNDWSDEFEALREGPGEP